MVRNVRLDEHGTAFGIQAGGEPIQQHFQRVFLYSRSVGVIGSESVPVGYEEKTFILILHANPVIESSDEVSQMKLARRAHSADDACPLIRRTQHQILDRMDKISQAFDK